MKRIVPMIVFLAVRLLAEAIDLPNGSFENGYEHWSSPEMSRMSAITDEKAHTGRHSLRIVDESTKDGSAFTSEPIAVEGNGMLRLSGWYCPIFGKGCGLYLRQVDGEGKGVVEGNDSHIFSLGGSQGEWLPFSVSVPLRKGTVRVVLNFHSYSNAKVKLYIDDLQMEVIPYRENPPWPPKYNIKPDEKAKLTAADVVGPDGIVYPNWTRCGVEGGIPDVPNGVNIQDSGGVADDEVDDQPAFEKACAKAAETGGAVILNEGTYILKSPLNILTDGVVIRGQGMGKSVIKFTYALPEEGIRFAWPVQGAELKQNSIIEVHALPTGLETITVFANGKSVHTWKRSTHSGNTFSTAVWFARLANIVKDGDTVNLKAIARYDDGVTRETSVTAICKAQEVELVHNTAQSWKAAIHFRGNTIQASKVLLARDALRGEQTITLEPNEAGIKAGDCLLLDGPATKRWKELTQNACKWGTYRQYAVRVKSIEGTRVVLEQPLRIDFPVVDGSYIIVQRPIQHCGVENVTIEQTENLWISTVLFNVAWNCWAKNVEVIKCGRFPVYGSQAKFCEIRDCVFRDAWFKGGGGTAYAGWEHSWDCLMDGIETFEYRHAPLFQWAASGCVIRNGHFHNSDGQWHSGWTNENLMENCVIESTRANGSYGYGLWASPPEDDAHGPNGPRNVVYNCDITSPRSGLWMGGMNECWLILHNRFRVKDGDGIIARISSFDHVIRHNVFIIEKPSMAAINLISKDCFNIEFANNTIYGTTLTAGWGNELLKQHENLMRPLDAVGEAARPSPSVPSIFEWQRQNAMK